MKGSFDHRQGTWSSVSTHQTAMILPVFKLGTLAVRTLAKPIANRLKKQAGLHPRFREFIISIAQGNHRFRTQLQRLIYSRSTDVAIRPLNEEKAVQAASDLIGELFIFTVAGALLVYEVQRNAKSEARKEELRRQEIEAMRRRDAEIAREIEILKHKIEEVEKLSRSRGLAGAFSTRFIWGVFQLPFNIFRF